MNIVLPTDLPVGAEIVVHQEVRYTGTASFNNNITPIVLNQYVAVLEPSSLAVLGFEAVLALMPFSFRTVGNSGRVRSRFCNLWPHGMRTERKASCGG